MKGKIKFFLTMCGLFGAGLIATLIFKDEIIVYMGIGAFKALRGVCGVATLLTAFGSGVTGVTTISKLRDQEMIERKQREFIEDSHKKETAKLSVKDKLENSKLRELLQEKLQNGWEPTRELIDKCIEQLQQMDDYQDRLSRLLKSNDAQMLSDTEEVLDRVEQYICKNVRKVLNYMEVADYRTAEDVNLVRSKLSACCADNQEQLKQTQEFIFALTDFINQQGDSDNDVSMLELYKKTILDSVKD